MCQYISGDVRTILWWHSLEVEYPLEASGLPCLLGGHHKLPQFGHRGVSLPGVIVYLNSVTLSWLENVRRFYYCEGWVFNNKCELACLMKYVFEGDTCAWPCLNYKRPLRFWLLTMTNERNGVVSPSRRGNGESGMCVPETRRLKRNIYFSLSTINGISYWYWFVRVKVRVVYL